MSRRAYLYICSCHAACRSGPKQPPELDPVDSARPPVIASRAETSPPYAAERTAANTSSSGSEKDADVDAVVDGDVVVDDVVAGAVTSEKEVATGRPKA